jgi:hypothetical protein
MHTHRFTYNGNTTAEKMIFQMLNKISFCISNLVPSKQMKALILLGGYGKGEGGLVKENGTYLPHNNFDLLLVTSDLPETKRRNIYHLVTKKMQSLAQKLGVGIDISVIPETKIKSMPTRVLWYDMKEGHRTISGDKHLIPSLPHFKKNIPSWDMRNLMVNRGSLLIINALCLATRESDQIPTPELPREIKKLIIKHTMKAIIGYGDALLYFNNNYHWSYKEKHTRILKDEQFSLKFKRLYNDAISFRFSPNYEYYLEKNLESWQKEVTKQLSIIHLECESIRLNCANLTWDNYLEVGLSNLVKEHDKNFKSAVKKIFNLSRFKSGKLPSELSFQAKLAYRTSSDDNILPTLFPFIAFNPAINHSRHDVITFISSHLKSVDDSFINVIKAYIKNWGKSFDPNLWSVLSQHNITLSGSTI